MAAKPHVSPALAALRLWVTVAATAVVLAAFAQMLIFGIVRGTDVRHTHVAPMLAESAPLVVVNPDGGHPKDSRAVAAAPAQTPVDVNRVIAPADGVMRQASGLAGAAGAIACVILTVLCLVGAVVAGGGAVPGVDRAVRAAAWSLVLMLVCLPWRDLMPSLPVPGVFRNYDAMVAQSEQTHATAGDLGAMLLTYLAMPALAVICATLVCLWFRAGVERGVIYTSVSQIDRTLEREMSTIREAGVASRQPRAIGALYRAIGDSPEDDAPAPVEVGAGEIAGNLLRRDPPQRPLGPDRPLGAANPGSGWKRPI